LWYRMASVVTGRLCEIVDSLQIPTDPLRVAVDFSDSDIASKFDEAVQNQNELVEIATKGLLYQYSQISNETDKITRICALLDFVLELSQDGRCEFSLAHSLVEELFEIETITWCQRFWPYLISRETRIAKNLTGNRAPGTTLIRLCNSLVRRLSKNHDAQFSGQIAMFLARAFPLSEKSGLNMRGTFNTENVTIYEDTKIDAEGDAVLDSDMYGDFWSLQSIFADPTKLFNQEAMEEFKIKAIKVLEFLEANDNAESKKGSRKKRKSREKDWKLSVGEMAQSESQPESVEDDEVFLPKWLTRRELFDLQIKDVSFRMTVATQLYILADFMVSLTEGAKSKWPQQHAINKSVMFTYTLSNHDETFFTEILKRIRYRSGGYPGSFLITMNDIVSRDKNWQLWKLRNCPSFERDKFEPDNQMTQKLATLRQPRKKFWHPMGTAALSKAWKIDTGLSRLRSENPVPSAQDYYTRLQQVQADEEVDQELASSLTWRGLRAARDRGESAKYGNMYRDQGFGGLSMSGKDKEKDKEKEKGGVSRGSSVDISADRTVSTAGPSSLSLVAPGGESNDGNAQEIVQPKIHLAQQTPQAPQAPQGDGSTEENGGSSPKRQKVE
jgi:THO complex subunit 1